MFFDIKKIKNPVQTSFDVAIPGAEVTPENPVVKPQASAGITSTRDGFEAGNAENPLLDFYGQQSERSVSNRQVIPPDPTIDASKLFNYFTEDQIPAPPVPPEVGNESMNTLSLPGDAIDTAAGAVEDATVTAGFAAMDAGEGIGDAAKWVAGAAADVAEEVDSALNSVTDGKFGEVTKDVGHFAEARAWDVFRAAEDVGIALTDAGEWFVDASGDAIGVAADAGEWTVDAAEDIAEAAAKAAEEAAKAAAKAAAEAAEAAANAAEDVIDEVGEVLEDVGEAVGDVASDVGDFIGDLW
jgi:hypothetical protein